MERKEFVTEFLNYQEELIRYVTNELHDQPQAEDMVGRLFVNIWSKWDGSLKKETLRSYLIKSLENEIKNHYKTYVRRQTYVNQQEVLYDLYNPEKQYLSKEFLEIIDKAGSDYVEIFMLKKIDKLKNREIAEQLSVSESTVKRRVKKATQILQKLLRIEFFILIPILIKTVDFLIDLCKQTLFK